MPPAELVQLSEEIAGFHGSRAEDAPRRRGPPALSSGQATVQSLADDAGDRRTALLRNRANPLVPFLIEEDLQPVRQHTHTLACTYSEAARSGG
jgi:hypothetical protein